MSDSYEEINISHRRFDLDVDMDTDWTLELDSTLIFGYSKLRIVIGALDYISFAISRSLPISSLNRTLI